MAATRNADSGLEPFERDVCAGCGQLAPQTTDDSRTSARYGWRLTLGRDASGRKIPEWRCARCSAKPRPTEADSEPEPIERKVFLGCGQLSPPTTEHSLISVRHGWRLMLERDGLGRKTPEWRCPTCYAHIKELRKRTG